MKDAEKQQTPDPATGARVVIHDAEGKVLHDAFHDADQDMIVASILRIDTRWGVARSLRNGDTLRLAIQIAP